MIDPLLQADLKGAEACKLTAYKDSLGLWTIGWGHLIGDGKGDHAGLTITQEQADRWLEEDLESAQVFAEGTTEWAALDTPCRRNAVVELCYNMRRKWLLFVNTRAAIRRQDWKAAHDGLLTSLWAEQVHETRANRLAGYLLIGEYPARGG